MNMGNNGSKKTTEWSPARYIGPGSLGQDSKPFALLILNQEIMNLDLFGNLWSNSRRLAIFISSLLAALEVSNRWPVETR